MSSKRAFPGASTAVFDFCAGLAVFFVLASWLGGGDVAGLSAHATELAWPPEFVAFDAPPPVELMAGAAAARDLPSLASLAVAFATALTLNLWLARHISSTYATVQHRASRSRRR